jgi:hypothetical protein
LSSANMPDNASVPSRRSCPYCGKGTGLKWWVLLPSNTRNREYKCRACSGKYDLSDTSRIASLFGGMLGLGPGIFLFGHLAKLWGHSALVTAAGTLVVVVVFGIGSLSLAWLTLRLEKRS